MDAQRNPLNVEALQLKLKYVHHHPAGLTLIRKSSDYATRRSPSEDSFVTPPPLTEAEEIEEARILEAETRLRLIEEGCPPCYPAHLDVPSSLQQLPEQYAPIISHWQSIGGATFNPLKSQLNDWERFRSYQQRIRPWMSRNLPAYKQKIFDRRRKHGLEGDVSLHMAIQPDPKQQGPLENWIEFQYNHLCKHESMEGGVQEIVEEVHDRRSKVRGMAGLQTKIAQEHRLGLEMRENWLETLKRRLGSHAELLRWIEEQRLAMIEEHTASAHDSGESANGTQHGQPALPNPRRSTDRKQGRRPRPATGSLPSGISKITPQRRKLRSQQAGDSKRRDTGMILCELYSAPVTSPSLTDSNATESRSANTMTALRPFRPQRIAKATAKVSKESPSLKSISKGLSIGQRSRKTNKNRTQKIMQQRPATRAGRIPKQPDRFQPG